jgi:hypothetical protein
LWLARGWQDNIGEVIAITAPRRQTLSDEWMDTLDINLWDEPRRAKIEELLWTLAQ